MCTRIEKLIDVWYTWARLNCKKLLFQYLGILYLLTTNLRAGPYGHGKVVETYCYVLLAGGLLM